MSVKLVTIYWSNYDSGISKTLVRGLLQVDTLADLPGPDDITGYRLTIGTEADIIDTAARYKMDSNGTWYIQEQGTDFYTKAETDALIQAAENYWFDRGVQIPAGSDFNDDLYKVPGIYYIASNADAGTISNRPATYGGRLLVFPTIDNTMYLKHIYICNDDQGLIYTRRSLSVGWSSWICLTPDIVAFSTGAAITATMDNPYDLNTLQTIGRYYFGGSSAPYLVNAPSDMSTAYGGEIIVDRIQLSNRFRQTILLNSNTHAGKRWERIAYTGTIPNLTWSSWYRFDGTTV